MTTDSITGNVVNAYRTKCKEGTAVSCHTSKSIGYFVNFFESKYKSFYEIPQILNERHGEKTYIQILENISNVRRHKLMVRL